jgi:ABC-type sugar transport system substrate-binding protein
VVLSINDAGAFGAIRALEEAGIGPDQVIVSSIDAEQLATQYIRKCYYMRGSLNVGRREIAQHLIYMMIRLLAGGSVPETITRPQGEMITRANLAEYEATGAATTPLPDSC